MFCSNCGNQLPDNASFCSKCGVPVSGKKSGKKGAVIAIVCCAVIALIAVIVCIAITSNRSDAEPTLNSQTAAAPENGSNNSGESKNDKDNTADKDDEEEGLIVFDFPVLKVHGDDYDWSAVKADEPYKWDDGTVFYPDDGLIVYENGDYYIGDWENNQKSGWGMYYFKSGVIYEGEFENGDIRWIGRLLFNDGSMYEGFCPDGTPYGTGILLTADGKEYNGGWINGRYLEGEGEWERLNDSEFPATTEMRKRRLGENTVTTTETTKPVSKDPVLVAEALSENPTAYKITSDSVYIQDLVDFCDGQLSYDDMTSKDYYRRTFKGERRGLQGH